MDPVARTRRTAELIEQLLVGVGELEAMHPGRKFTPDGHLVGSIGEVAAAALFAIELVAGSAAGHDAVSADGRKIEIKATFGTRAVGIRSTSTQHAAAALIVLKLAKEPGHEHEVVYNGPLTLALGAAGATQSNGQATVSLTRLRELDRSVPDDQRVPRRPEPEGF